MQWEQVTWEPCWLLQMLLRLLGEKLHYYNFLTITLHLRSDGPVYKCKFVQKSFWTATKLCSMLPSAPSNFFHGMICSRRGVLCMSTIYCMNWLFYSFAALRAISYRVRVQWCLNMLWSSWSWIDLLQLTTFRLWSTETCMLLWSGSSTVMKLIRPLFISCLEIVFCL